jgi:SNF2 family DNA or RNA helicase
MGLGKTLSMISLIASDLLVDQSDPNSVTGANAEDSSGRTLIVVPPPRKWPANDTPSLITMIA